MSFDNWRMRLAGGKPSTFLQPQLEDEGYYRKPLVEPKLGPNGKTNGQKRVIGWEPVAYFVERGMLRGVIGDRDMAANEVTDETLWSYVCRNPITEELYRAVAERGESWPDLPEPVNHSVEALVATVPAANREVERSDNQPPEEPAHIRHATAIDNAIAVAKDIKITTDDEAALALGIKNRLAELRLDAQKAGAAVYKPVFDEYKKLHGIWTPMVARAEAAEKTLNTSYLLFRQKQKLAADMAAAAAKKAQEEIDEANERAAQRAIARGETEAAPVITEAPPGAVPAPSPVVATYRAPGQRATKEVEKWHFDGVEDWDKLYGFLKDNEGVKAAMTVLAKAMVATGRDVPGVKRHFGLI